MGVAAGGLAKWSGYGDKSCALVGSLGALLLLERYGACVAPLIDQKYQQRVQGMDGP